MHLEEEKFAFPVATRRLCKANKNFNRAEIKPSAFQAQTTSRSEKFCAFEASTLLHFSLFLQALQIHSLKKLKVQRNIKSDFVIKTTFSLNSANFN